MSVTDCKPYLTGHVEWKSHKISETMTYEETGPKFDLDIQMHGCGRNSSHFLPSIINHQPGKPECSGHGSRTGRYEKEGKIA